MARTNLFLLPLLLLLLLLSLANVSIGARHLTYLVQQQPNPLTYHNGLLLQGNIPVSILWYGHFTSPQKSILTDFVLSLTTTTTPQAPTPSVSQWWNTINQFYLSKVQKHADIVLTNQVTDENCSLGKLPKLSQLPLLASKAQAKRGGIAVIFTAQDVTVEGFCMSRCGLHSSDSKSGTAYIWVGNSITQCPGQCAWPFYRPIYGPQTPPLTAPNGDVGVDGMVINLASMVAGAVTNPFGNGFYQGDKGAPLEAATACAGVYGKGAYPGYAGELLVDTTSGASYNVNGAHGRKYLVPALFNPSTSTCSTLV